MKTYKIAFRINDEVLGPLSGKKLQADITIKAENEQKARDEAMEWAKQFYNTVLPGVIGISSCEEVEDSGFVLINCKL